MRVIILAVLFTASVWAQITSGTPTAACGPGNVSFKVNLDQSQHTPAQPNPGKALVYFIHDAGTEYTLGYPTVKVALDGAWVGANHGDSYFSVSVDPGEHHLCVALQSSMVSKRVELAHFTAEADATYYYRTRLLALRSIELLDIESVDSDQGKYLISSFPLSVSAPKK